MRWAYDDPVTGERLQALAEVTVLTRPIYEFHASLARAGVREVVGFRGSHSELEPDAAAIDRLRGRRTIFVYTHLVRSFIERVLPRLDHRFVLITHNSDHGIDAHFLPALGDARIVHWFAQNASLRHPHLTALPIGIANAQWPHGDLPALLAAANRVRERRRPVLYVNFDVRTNPAVRAPLLQQLQRSPLAWCAAPRPFAQYLEDMAGCRWVLSPPGNGVDCHRTWETLYLGATPIVLRSDAGAALHDGLPVVQLADLAAVDPSLLAAAEAGVAAAGGAWERLTMRYWRSRVAEQARLANV